MLIEVGRCHYVLKEQFDTLGVVVFERDQSLGKHSNLLNSQKSDLAL